jgi:hypothetical protein
MTPIQLSQEKRYGNLLSREYYMTMPQIFARARGPGAGSAHKIYSAHYRVLIRYVFVYIVTESETFRIN